MKILIALFFLFTNLLFSETTNDKNELKFNQQVIKGELENGLKYYILNNKTPKNTAYLYLYIKAGSINEASSESGLAHFTEHMVFNGTKEFSKNQTISTLESLGVKFGADLNAMTGFDSTIYNLIIQSSPANIKTALKVLSNMAFEATFDTGEIEKEKGVIIEENRQRDSSKKRIFDQELDYIYGDSLYAKRLPIGDMSVIKNATTAQFKSWYNKNYLPKNMSVIAVGDFDENSVISLIKELFSYKTNEFAQETVDKKIPFFDKFIYFNAHDKELDSESIGVYYEDKFVATNSVFGMKKELLSQFISRLVSLNSNRLKSKNLLLEDDDFYSFDLQAQKRLFVFEHSVVGEDFNASIKNLFAMINSLKKNGFEKEDFDSVKKDLIAQNEAFLKTKPTRNSSFYVSEIIKYISNNSTFMSDEDKFELKKELLEKITLKDVNQELRRITELNGIIVESVSQNKLGLKQSDIKKFLYTKTLDDNSTKVLPKTLLKSEPEPVNFTKREFDEKSSIFTYKFPNGATVLFKPLLSRKNSVAFDFISLGGATNVSNLQEVNLAVEISNGSGIGEFNDYEVSKITNGEVFGFSRYFSRISHGFRGSSTSDDFKAAMRAFYADFTQPKIDEEYALRFKKLQINYLNKTKDLPDYRFAKELQKALYNGNEKMRDIDISDLEKINKTSLENIIKANFTNASDFTFIFVADLNQSKFEDIIKRYIGSLPSTKNSAKILDDGINIVDGEQTLQRYFNRQNQQQTSIYIKSNSQNVDFNSTSKYKATTSVLSNLLREKIRQNDSSVYSIAAHIQISKLPRPNIITTINYSCDPLKRYEVMNAVKSVINSLAKGEIGAKFLDDYKTQAEVSLKKSFEEPNFWLNEIKISLINGEKLYLFDERLKAINNLNLQDIAKSAKELYLGGNFFGAMLSPVGLENSK